MSFQDLFEKVNQLNDLVKTINKAVKERDEKVNDLFCKRELFLFQVVTLRASRSCLIKWVSLMIWWRQ